MYSIGVLALCAGLDCSTLCVKMTQSFSYRIRHYFTAHNVRSVYQVEKALSVVYTPSTALHKAHYVWCTGAVEPLGVGYPPMRVGTTASKPLQKNLSYGATASTTPRAYAHRADAPTLIQTHLYRYNQSLRGVKFLIKNNALIRDFSLYKIGFL